MNLADTSAAGFYERAARYTGSGPYTEWFAGATWHPAPGLTDNFQAGPFFSQEERDQCQRLMLDAMGYTKPRWWQYWRWGEHPQT